MTLAARLDELFQTNVESGKLAAVSAVVITEDTEIYRAGFGNAEHHKVDEHSVGAIMSMTKAITGAAAMQLVERGQLSLDAPAGEVCPYLGQVQVFTGFADDGSVNLRPPATPVTLSNLLTHTSGFVYDVWNEEFGRVCQTLGIPPLGTRQKAALEVPLMFDS